MVYITQMVFLSFFETEFAFPYCLALTTPYRCWTEEKQRKTLRTVLPWDRAEEAFYLLRPEGWRTYNLYFINTHKCTHCHLIFNCIVTGISISSTNNLGEVLNHKDSSYVGISTYNLVCATPALDPHEDVFVFVGQPITNETNLLAHVLNLWTQQLINVNEECNPCFNIIGQ